MLNKLKNNRGSTLLMTLMTMTVLTILGTAIIAISVSNFKMRVIAVKGKESLYKADSKYEEIYSVISRTVEAGIQQGNQNVDNNMTSEISRLRNLEGNDIEVDHNDVINGKDGMGSIDDDELMKHMDSHFFEPAYKTYINDHLIADITSSIIDIDLNTTVPITLNNTDLNGIDDDNFKFTITYPSTHKDMNRTILGSYNIKVPDYEKPIDVVNNMVSIKENVLWKKAISTDGNLKVKCDEATINGDIYVYGDGDEAGISVDKLNSKLTVSGNVISDKWISTKKNGSKIHINNGDVYCNSLVIPEGVVDTEIIINNGDVNTFDDIELNGRRSNIEINGSFYGFSDGSLGVNHDESSAIIINSEDIDSLNGSKLKITGNHVTNNMDHISVLEYDHTDSGIYVYGTMYVDLEGANFYQSGESISIKGNYRAYDRKLQADGTRGDKYQPNNIELGSYPPLVMVSNITDTNGTRHPNAVEKAEYFAYYNSDYGGLRTGRNDSIQATNVKYMLGAYVDNTVKEFTGAINEDLRIKKDRDYKYLTNHMADLGLLNTTLHDVSGGFTQGVLPLSTKVDIEDRLSLTSANDINWYDNTLGSSRLIVMDSSKDVYIYSGSSPAGYNPSNDIGIRTNSSGIIDLGIIVTSGKVYIIGDIEYNGIIVAEDDVELLGGNITLRNNYNDNFTFRRSLIGLITSKDKSTDGFYNVDNLGREIFYSKETRAEESSYYTTYRRLQKTIDVTWTRVR